MSNLIFAFMQAYGGDERESLLLARSLREFGGELANQPLWLMMPQGSGAGQRIHASDAGRAWGSGPQV